MYQVMQDVIKLGSVEASFQAKSLVKINSYSNELTFTICTIMEHYEKCLTKIKTHLKWDSNHQPDAYGFIAAYTIVFYALLSMNGDFCRLMKINSVFFKDTAFISSKSCFD